MLSDLIHQWHSHFGPDTPQVIVRSPGRVNIIGEHTDYNEGWVMPGAMNLCLYIVVSRSLTAAQNNASLHHWVAADLNETIVFELDKELPDTRTIWPKYIHGAIHIFEGALGPLNILIGGNLPIGAGVSSSSSLVGGLLLAFQQLTGDTRTKQELANLSSRVEKEVIGLQGGIMDQYAIMLSQKDKVMMLDRRDQTYTHIPAAIPGTKWLLINTKVKHQLIDSDYNQRANQCHQAVIMLQQMFKTVKSLRDVSMEMLEKCEMPDLNKKRCQYVIEENKRVEGMKQALANKDAVTAGRLLTESHQGLQVLYEVSCEELDFLAHLANATEGVYGSRMMGGGFGGCVICLVREDAEQSFVEKAISAYDHQFGFEPDVIYFSLDDGASVISL
nr:gal_kin [uncultured bacterium]